MCFDYGLRVDYRIWKKNNDLLMYIKLFIVVVVVLFRRFPLANANFSSLFLLMLTLAHCFCLEDFHCFC